MSHINPRGVVERVEFTADCPEGHKDALWANERLQNGRTHTLIVCCGRRNGKTTRWAIDNPLKELR